MVGYALTPTVHMYGEINDRRGFWLSCDNRFGTCLFGITAGSTARAAEIKLLCAVACNRMRTDPDLKNRRGTKSPIAYGTTGAVADRVQKGEAADIVIKSVATDDQLQAQAKCAGSPASTSAKSVLVLRTQGARSRISSGRRLQTLDLAARSIAYPDRPVGCQWIYVAACRRLASLWNKPKTKLFPPTEGCTQALPAATLRSEQSNQRNLGSTNVQLAGPLPSAIQILHQSPWHRYRQQSD